MKVWLYAAVGVLMLAACSPIEGGPRLLIAPHVNGAAFCPSAADDPAIISSEDAAAYCAERGENAASRIEAALAEVGPARSPSGRYELGYLLSLPLMRYMVKRDGEWTIDQRALDHDVSLIRDIDRPVVVLVSANHFTEAGFEIAAELAADDRNLMWTRSGPLRGDNYFGIPLVSWTIADDEAPITQLRRSLFSAAASTICALDAESRQRVAAIAMLGEVHHFFPDLIQGAGFNSAFDVTDYSPASIAGFRSFLAQRFGSVAAMNAALGSRFRDFQEVSAPSADVLAAGGERLAHLDASAAGNLAIHGWAYDPSGGPLRMTLLVDGRPVQQTIADFNRPDVSEADPDAPSPNVGWRFDYDYRSLSEGGHTIQVVARGSRGRVVRFGARRFWVGAGAASGGPAVPDDSPSTRGLRMFFDYPSAEQRILYNPLAALWLEYRNDQVRRYYEQFALLLRETCLRDTAIHSHQMPPQLNSNWNRDFFAVYASQQSNDLYLPGSDLYDGAAFGDAFFRMKADLGWTTYGLGELNPSHGWSQGEMQTMLNRHRENGARYVAPYYYNIAPDRIWDSSMDSPLKRMEIAPDNPYPESGGAAFYAAISHLMRNE